MTYSELMLAPMRKELTSLGFTELRSPQDVDAFMQANQGSTVLLVVNSICGCAAGSLRPALARALEIGPRPQTLATVFAGQDIEATDRARQLFVGYPPSSPAAALFKDGELVMMLERHQIQGRPPAMLAEELAAGFGRLTGEGAAV